MLKKYGKIWQNNELFKRQTGKRLNIKQLPMVYGRRLKEEPHEPG